ncbi:MAG: XdhC family protein [Actinomycetota bacterium]|nr:XdhC family protein [Actinomycetota bacterium]
MSSVPESVIAGATGPDTTLVLVTRTVIADAVVALCAAVGLTTLVLDHHDGPVVGALAALPVGQRHAVVLTDHDAPGTAEVIRAALAAGAGYVGMMGSRSRARGVFETLRVEGLTESSLACLHVPVGLDTGGRTAGEMGLSVVAEVVAWANGKLVRTGDRSGLQAP